MAFYLHILTTMHGQTHIKFITLFKLSDHNRTVDALPKNYKEHFYCVCTQFADQSRNRVTQTRREVSGKFPSRREM